MNRTFLLIGALVGFTGVTLGAFGAHGLRGRLSPELLAVFETGVRYQMYHAVAILFAGLLLGRSGGRLVSAAGWFFTAGIVLFSGSLYLVTLAGLTRAGAITPLGGLALLAGWACLALSAVL